MSHAIDRLLAGLAAAAAALPVNAALILKQVHTSEGGDDSGRQVTESIVDGGNVKMTFLESSNPMMGPGSYMLKNQTSTFLVNPQTKSYMRMDASEFAAAGAQMNAAEQKEKEEMEKRGFGTGEKTLKGFEFKTLVDEAGPKMLDLPTHHYKYELKYQVSQPMQGTVGMNVDRSVDRIEEFWATTAIDVKGATGGEDTMAAMSGDTHGDDAFPQVADAEKTMNEKGLRLKSVKELKESSGMGGMANTMIKIQTFGMAGGKQKIDTRSTEEVLELHQENVPASTFALPNGYSEMSMMGPSNMPNLNQIPGGPGTGMPDLNQMPPGASGPSGMPDLNNLPPY